MYNYHPNYVALPITALICQWCINTILSHNTINLMQILKPEFAVGGSRTYIFHVEIYMYDSVTRGKLSNYDIV